MKKCSECKAEMKILTAKTPDGVKYNYYHCSQCGEEVVDMKQLHDVAKQYREMKRYHAKVSKWGTSLGVRIPKPLAKQYGLRDDEQVTIIPEKEGMRIIPI